MDRKGLRLWVRPSALLLQKLDSVIAFSMFGKNAFSASLSSGLSVRAARVSLVIGVCPPSLGKSLVFLPGLVANFVHCALLAEVPGGRCGAGPGR